MKMNKRRIVLDMILNVSAAAIPLAMLQLLVYPILSRYLIENEYGLMITMYSLWLMISNTLGNVIFNVRLIKNNKYEENRLQGDFLVIVLRYAILNAIIVSAVTFYYDGGFELKHFILSLCVACILFLKSYLDVCFRLVIDFRAVTISGILVAVGFLLGSFAAIKTGIWEFIYIVGYSFGCVYAIKKSDLMKESRTKTPLFKETQLDCNKLMVASIVANLMTYADKLVIFPLMGGKAVAVYYNATLLAKIVGMVTGPSSGVILTYLAKRKSGDGKSFKKMLIVGLIVVTIGYFVVLLLSRPIMSILYPMWVDEIMIYIPVTTINVSILALISMLNPFVLRYCDMKWQILISGGGVIVYFIAALVLWHFWGLMGFCIGTVIGSITRLILIICVHHFNIEKED